MQKNAVKFFFILILSSLVYSNSNITLLVVDCIENLYQILWCRAPQNTIRLKKSTQHRNLTSKHRKHIIKTQIINLTI